MSKLQTTSPLTFAEPGNNPDNPSLVASIRSAQFASLSAPYACNPADYPRQEAGLVRESLAVRSWPIVRIRNATRKRPFGTRHSQSALISFKDEAAPELAGWMRVRLPEDPRQLGLSGLRRLRGVRPW